MVLVAGNKTYVEHAARLAERYETYDVTGLYDWFIGLMSPPPLKLLDLGAGTGREAMKFASLGYEVTAVEPTDAFRAIARAKEGANKVIWIDDSLPDLIKVPNQTFDIVTMLAVFMHLDQTERGLALQRISSLMSAGAFLFMTVRHGPVPEGRRVFQVPDEEVIKIADSVGLHLSHLSHASSIQPQNIEAGVTWSQLAFEKA